MGIWFDRLLAASAQRDRYSASRISTARGRFSLDRLVAESVKVHEKAVAELARSAGPRRLWPALIEIRLTWISVCMNMTKVSFKTHENKNANN